MVTSPSNPWIIREETDADELAIHAVNRAAFGGPLEADLVDALRQGGHVDVSLVAVLEGRVVGHILFSTISILTANGPVAGTSLAPLSVLPMFHRRGIGTALVYAGLEQCRQRGCRFAVVLGHPEFYPRFGFSAELARPLKCSFGGGEAWCAAELVSGSLTGVAGRVEYAAPFRVFE